MTKPKLVEAEDEHGWRLINPHDKKTTIPRINPAGPLNPLKGVPLEPNMYRVHKQPKNDVNKWTKNRRLSRVTYRSPTEQSSQKHKMYFSTFIGRPQTPTHPLATFIACLSNPFRQE